MEQLRAKVTLGSLTHVGMKRSNNQDAFCALAGANAPAGTDALIAVADGMGGRKAGEVASTMTIQGLVERLSRDGSKDATLLSVARLDSVLSGVVSDLNSEVYKEAQRPQTQGMGTTLTAGLLVGQRLFLAHVGDSRAYLLRGKKLKQLTNDHSWVAEEVARGALRPGDAANHPARNVITRALGISPEVDVDVVALEVEERDLFLICSDGLHSVVPDEEIADVLGSHEPQRACELLIERANGHGGPDNVTVVVLRIDGIEQVSGSSEHFREQQTLSLRRSKDGILKRVASKIAKLVGRSDEER